MVLPSVFFSTQEKIAQLEQEMESLESSDCPDDVAMVVLLNSVIIYVAEENDTIILMW